MPIMRITIENVVYALDDGMRAPLRRWSRPRAGPVSKATSENNLARELITTSKKVALDFRTNGQAADAAKAALDFFTKVGNPLTPSNDDEFHPHSILSPFATSWKAQNGRRKEAQQNHRSSVVRHQRPVFGERLFATRLAFLDGQSEDDADKGLLVGVDFPESSDFFVFTWSSACRRSRASAASRS